MIFLSSGFKSEEIEMTEPEGGDDSSGAALNGFRILTRRLIVRRPLGKPKRRWNNKLRIGFRKTDGSVEVFSNHVHLVDIYNMELLLKVLHMGIKTNLCANTIR
jgi:hypothetical protein